VRNAREPNDKLDRATDNMLAEADRKAVYFCIGISRSGFPHYRYWCQCCGLRQWSYDKTGLRAQATAGLGLGLGLSLVDLVLILVVVLLFRS